MFQFQGSITDNDIEAIITILKRKKILKIENNKVNYLL
jgi:hypothetical protein